jgi:hypothetical protein
MRSESAEKSPQLIGKRGDFWLSLAISFLLALYVYVLIAVTGKMFADDSYFYFQVAWNFAHGRGSTFNGMMPTNGYHPLWMLVCAGVYKFVQSKTLAVHFIGAVIALLNVLMLWTVRRVLARVAGNLWPVAFLLILPFCFLSQLGTEGALSALFLALLMLFAYRMSSTPSAREAVLFSLMGAIAVLSRLDNIFIVSIVWLAVWIALGDPGKRQFRRMQMMALPIYGVLWGAYIGSNIVYFHILEPISGYLKSHSAKDHALGSNLPHTAFLAMGIIVVCLVIVAWRKRDLFFRVVEVPFALGVLCHATYIVLFMSSETRWSWYYTSWILLAGVLLARAASVLLAEKRWLAMPLAMVCLLVLAGAWIKVSYFKFYKGPPRIPPASFNEAVFEKAGIRNAFAYDQPGMLAYYSNVHIVPLDGLMGDIEFQHELATKGLAKVAAEEHIDGFIGPPEAFSATDKKALCDHVYISSEQFHCVKDADGNWHSVGVDVYARVPTAMSGTIALDQNNIVWSKKGYLTVWKLSPSSFSGTSGPIGAPK